MTWVYRNWIQGRFACWFAKGWSWHQEWPWMRKTTRRAEGARWETREDQWYFYADGSDSILHELLRDLGQFLLANLVTTLASVFNIFASRFRLFSRHSQFEWYPYGTTLGRPTCPSRNVSDIPMISHAMSGLKLGIPSTKMDIICLRTLMSLNGGYPNVWNGSPS